MARNCLFITADQWRGDHLGIAGHPQARTPNIDRLATDGVLFSRHFGQATPCGPSRASILTGQYAFNHRSITNGTPLDHRHLTLAQAVRAGGYDPVVFGYTDTSMDPRTLDPDDPRLRTYESILPGFRCALHLDEAMTPWLDELESEVANVDDLYSNRFGEAAPYPAARSETAFLADRFLRWLEEQRSDASWFAHLSFIKPHPPWIATEPYHSLHARGDIAMPRPVDRDALARMHPWLAAHLATPYGGWPGRVFGSPAGLSEDRVRELRAVYLGLMSEVDHHLGRILDALTDSGRLDDTLVIFTSDHGEMLGDHGMIGKSGFFPQAFHVPLVIRDPRNAKARGSEVGSFTEHVDLMPTMLDWLGLPVPRQCDGHSLSNFLTGKGTPAGWRDAVFYEHDFRESRSRVDVGEHALDEESCGIAVRLDESSAYVHFSGLPPLAFDLCADPHWQHPVDDPAFILPRARAMLDWRMRKADRRLTGVQLTADGPVGAFDPLRPGA
ncbi:MAG: alkaline phosphatase family protein [Geminicoccaceae bacterium]